MKEKLKVVICTCCATEDLTEDLIEVLEVSEEMLTEMVGTRFVFALTFFTTVLFVTMTVSAFFLARLGELVSEEVPR